MLRVAGRLLQGRSTSFGMSAAVGITRPLSPSPDLPVKKPRLAKTFSGNSKRQKRKAKYHAPPEPCSPEDVLWRDAVEIIGQEGVDVETSAGSEFDAPFEKQEIVEFEVSCLSSDGRGMGLAENPTKSWVVVVPFALPGERVKAKIYKNDRLHSYADFVEILRANVELRDQTRVKCQYFTRCGGCQYQMLSYDTQLDFKRNVIVKAYKNFSNLDESARPSIGTTIPSPLQYGYRTKISPHFQQPPKNAAAQADKSKWLNIGFNYAGQNKTLDIEECPIATSVINAAYTPVREGIIKNILTYKKGVTLLLRDSLDISVPLPLPPASSPEEETSLSEAFQKHVCITNPKGTVRETVGDKIFEYHASSFFQNNNSVLSPLTDYIRDAILSTSSMKPTHLIDTYCGAGLFAITLSPHFETVAGIELSQESIESAQRNANLNNISDTKISFRKGDAADIFNTVGDFPPDKTVIVMDPPRKGSDDKFIQQLLRFQCQTIAYISCNVHTQMRDIGMILNDEQAAAGKRKKYVLESLRGFDLFPQTAHVESVAILSLV